MKNKNLIEVDYQVINSGADVRIVAIRNLLSGGEILKKYGLKALEAYGWSDAAIARSRDKVLIGEDYIVTLPIVLSKNKFNELIIFMRRAGENLSRIAKEYHEKQRSEIRTITI